MSHEMTERATSSADEQPNSFLPEKLYTIVKSISWHLSTLHVAYIFFHKTYKDVWAHRYTQIIHILKKFTEP